MKQQSIVQQGSVPPPMGSVDTATLALLAAWRVEDATSDPENSAKLTMRLPNSKRRGMKIVQPLAHVYSSREPLSLLDSGRSDC